MGLLPEDAAMRAEEPHPDAQKLLALIEEAGTQPISQWEVDRARELSRRMRPDVDGPPVGDVTHRTVPGFEDDDPAVPVRVYTPEGSGPFPTVAFFHGGGFVLGDLDSHDFLCRAFVRESGCAVVATDYRRAPEHPFPAAVEDAYAATRWAAGNPDAVDGTGALAVMGDSAGGTLAAAVTHLAADRADGPAIDYQALIYPSVSHRDDWDSRRNNSEGYYLVEADMQWFDDCYLPSAVHRGNRYAYPLEACDFADRPPATVLTAGFDPLRDEAVAYAEALEAAGVDVEHRHYPAMIHGFVNMLAGPRAVEPSHAALEAIATDVRETLA
jgi:acetyl esterase